MAPEYCPEHGGVCEKIGRIEANTERLCEEMKESKALLEKILAQQTCARVTIAQEKVKTGILYWAIRVSGVAGVSAIVTHLYKRLCGD